jgi:primosomal protein N' (replication factor Y) (superfamily II helicase)
VSSTVDVALLLQAVPEPLTYHVPDALRGQIAVGSAVSVPLQSRLVSGIVVAMHDGDPAVRVRPVQALLHEGAVLNATQLELARWISGQYQTPLGRACALMVPPGFTPKSAYLYALANERPNTTGQSTLAVRMIDLFARRGPQLEKSLQRVFRGEPWRETLEALVKRGLLTRQSTLEAPKVQPQRSTLVQLVLSEDTLALAIDALLDPATPTRIKPETRARRVALLRLLQARNGLSWADWALAETGSTRVDLSWLADAGYILLGDAERWRDPLADTDFVVKHAPPLTDDQARAWEAVRAGMTGNEDTSSENGPLRHSAFLLRGVTGSGKTEVYMRAVELAVSRGRGAIVLVPEISLTPQTARRFLERFPGKVALIHSRLRPGERFDTWRRIRSGELSIVVGARSGLFAPLPDVGLIVLDEEHDQSFKQSAAPYYDARRAAMHYAKQRDATLILGSATPSLEALAQSLDPRHPYPLKLLELPNRVRAHTRRIEDQAARLRVTPAQHKENAALSYQPLPAVEVIDMRMELRGGNTSMFSGALFQGIARTLQRREQAILFLNRRGAASSVLCRDCGHVLRCPDDDTPLTLHNAPQRPGQQAVSADAGGLLKCHTCGHRESTPRRCPVCGGPRIKYLGIGTQTIEDELQKRFPHARVVRWDKDTTAARDAADQMLKRFQQQQADILVGTQMIAKGLDLPMVTLVGVVLADVGLFLPDFRASERVFNLIEQVAGRAGRGLLPGRVVVQTYNPEHPSITFAAKHDVTGFAKHELALRKMLELPPHVRLVKFECAELDNDAARLKCEAVARLLRPRLQKESDLIGPASCFFARRARRFRWQLLVRTHDPAALLRGLDLPAGMSVDVDPASVL